MRLRSQGLVVLAATVLVGGCAARSAERSAGRIDEPAATTVVAEVRQRRSAELHGARDQMRLVDAELTVEFRIGKEASLDAGPVTLDGKSLVKELGRSGVTYRVGRDGLERLPPPGSDGWVELWVGGSASVARATARVQLAPLPLVLQPTPNQTVMRSEPLIVTTEGASIGPHVRVTLAGSAESISPAETGPGRWEFPAEAMRPMTPGDARLLIETDTSCGLCPATPDLALRWSSRSQLEIRLALY
jgi:hypothetical protein